MSAHRCPCNTVCLGNVPCSSSDFKQKHALHLAICLVFCTLKLSACLHGHCGLPRLCTAPELWQLFQPSLSEMMFSIHVEACACTP